MKILFITANRIGDAVLTTGLYGHLAARFPDAGFTVACGPLAAPLYAAAPGLERLIVLKKRRYAAHWLNLWRQTIGVHWDLVVDLRDSLVGRLVFARQRRILSAARPVKGQSPRHKVETLGAFLGLTPPPAPRLWLPAAAHAAAATLLGPDDGAPLLALAPTANWTAKEWPADRFAAVAQALLAPGGLLAGGRALVLAAPSEAGRAAATLAGLAAFLPPARVIDLVGRTDALTAAACIRRATLFIGNDSGLMHIAAATGTPTIGVFGPGYPEIYGPWGERAAVVVSETPAELLRARVRPDDPAPAGLMDGVPAAAVTAAAGQLLQPAADRETSLM